MTPQTFTDYLYAQIPLTAAMAIQVLAFDRQRVEIMAPLGPNVNHRGGAFGGALATLGIICGWALVHHALQQDGMKAHVAVRNSDADFREAVGSDFTAVSRLPEDRWPRFIDTLRRHRRGAIEVDTLISSGGRVLVRHHARYAASVIEAVEPSSSSPPGLAS